MSAHLLKRNAHVIVAYIDRGVMYICLPIPPFQSLIDLTQLLGHGESGHGLGNITEGRSTARLQRER